MAKLYLRNWFGVLTTSRLQSIQVLDGTSSSNARHITAVYFFSLCSPAFGLDDKSMAQLSLIFVLSYYCCIRFVFGNVFIDGRATMAANRFNLAVSLAYLIMGRQTRKDVIHHLKVSKKRKKIYYEDACTSSLDFSATFVWQRTQIIWWNYQGQFGNVQDDKSVQRGKKRTIKRLNFFRCQRNEANAGHIAHYS